MNKIRIRKKISANHFPIISGNILIFLAYSTLFYISGDLILLIIFYLIQFLFCILYSLLIRHRSIRQSRSWKLSGIIILIIGLILSIFFFSVPFPQNKIPSSEILEHNHPDSTDRMR